jgi:hypothetical protein
MSFALFEPTPDEGIGDRVPVVVDINISLDIDDAVVELVDLGDVERNGPKLRLLAGEKLFW